LQFLKKYVKKYWRPFCAAVICLTVEAFCDLMQPTIMSKIIDIGVAKKQVNYVAEMGIVMLLVTLLGALGAVGRNILASRVSQNFGAELRKDLFKKIQSFTFENIDRFEGASLVTRLTNDVTQVQNFVNGLMRIFVKAPILCIGSIIMAARLNSRMAIVLVIVVPIVSILIYFNLNIGFPYFIKVQKSLDKVNGVMREYLSGVRVVKAFNRFDFEVKRFEKSNEELGKVSTTAMRVMAVFSPGMAFTINLGIVFVLWFGGVRVSKGNMQVGQIMAFINYMTQILFSLMMISFVFNMFVRARASVERIGEIFAEENNIYSPKEADCNTSGLKGRIDFNNVCFSYGRAIGEPILKNVSFTCMPGETVGIIGSTGSGKSTLVSLIPRFYDVTNGTISINGVNVKNMNLEKLRDIIAFVPQKSVLFTGTVMENIRWGKENAPMEEVEVAAEIAKAHEFISSFPEKYNTLLGQGGVNFSGGQKQRVSIARAIIKKPEILILDDSTSAVDVTTENKIRNSLKEYMNGLTCIIIAQRITSVMAADKIIVLDNGEIIGMGIHEELMKSCKVYNDIYVSQLGKEEL
jgi:ATP-binding cassette, subfamily B, multidrug efflux pump